MAATASVISIALFLTFATSGAWKIANNAYAEGLAQRLNARESAWRILGAAEILVGLAVLAGLKGAPGSAWGIVNEAGAVVGTALALVMVVRMSRGQYERRSWLPWVGIAVVAIVELAFRLAQ
jgi:hypothetical protein